MSLEIGGQNGEGKCFLKSGSRALHYRAIPNMPPTNHSNNMSERLSSEHERIISYFCRAPSLDKHLRDRLNVEQMFVLIDGVLPIEACLYYQVLPLFLEGSRLNLGMVSPEDTAATDYVRRIVSYLNYSLVTRQISSEALQAALSAYLRYSDRKTNVGAPIEPSAASRRAQRLSSRQRTHHRDLDAANQPTLVVDSPDDLDVADSDDAQPEPDPFSDEANEAPPDETAATVRLFGDDPIEATQIIRDEEGAEARSADLRSADSPSSGDSRDGQDTPDQYGTSDEHDISVPLADEAERLEIPEMPPIPLGELVDDDEDTDAAIEAQLQAAEPQAAEPQAAEPQAAEILPEGNTGSQSAPAEGVEMGFAGTNSDFARTNPIDETTTPSLEALAFDAGAFDADAFGTDAFGTDAFDTSTDASDTSANFDTSTNVDVGVSRLDDSNDDDSSLRGLLQPPPPLELELSSSDRMSLEYIGNASPRTLLQNLLLRVLEQGIGRLYFERQDRHGKILWSQSGVLQSITDNIPESQFQAVIDELKEMNHLPVVAANQPYQVELERIYRRERVLLRLRFMPTPRGEEATLQVLRGAALRFYQHQQLARLGRDALTIAQALRRKVNELRDRTHTLQKVPTDQVEMLPVLSQMLVQIERQLDEMQQDQSEPT